MRGHPCGRVVALLLAIVMGVAVTSCDTSAPDPADDGAVPIGGLFSLTGNWSTLGRTSKAALEIAVEDVNRHLQDTGASLRLEAVVEDTRLEPTSALAGAQALLLRGAQIAVGPQSSAEVAAVKDFADANDLLIVSQSSTAGSLAIPGDNVFRFTPGDSLEGIAISALMWDDGKRAIVPVWRDDAGNAGLEAATRTSFGALGGAVLSGVPYSAETTDFEAIVTDIRIQVDDAIAQYGAHQVGVYLAAFDEVVGLFERAATDPVLGAVLWYGSDGVARSEALLDSETAVDFAIQVGYPNPIFGLDERARDKWEPLSARIHAATGIEPDAFALAVYDAVWVAALSYLASAAPPTFQQLKSAFPAVAENYFGATGWTILNAAGDRAYGDFDFWSVERMGGVPRWIRTARYETQTGTLVRK